MITATATGYKVQVEAKDTWLPNFVEDPYRDLTNAANNFTQSIADFIEGFVYWINPVNWARELWALVEKVVLMPETAVFLIAATIIGFWLIAIGFKFPKKLLFWSWVLYWILRGVVFA